MNNSISQLQKFRINAYNCLGFAKDATFDLLDAILTITNSHSLADFSLSPFFRRQWPSVYESLQDCRPNANKLMELYLQQIPGDETVDIEADCLIIIRSNCCLWAEPVKSSV